MDAHDAAAVYVDPDTGNAAGLCVLPHHVVRFIVEIGFFTMIFGDHPLVAGEGADQMLVVEVLVGVE